MSDETMTQDSEQLLQYHQGYWTGSDSQVHLELPHALLWRHYQAELRERGIAALTAEGAGRRAEAFNDCRKPAYWRMVDDPNLIRTPLAQLESQGNLSDQDKNP